MRLAAVALLLVPTFAHGDPVRIATAAFEGPPGMSRPDADSPPAVDQQPSPTTIATHSAIVGASRGLGVGTALTVPEGTFEVSARALAPFAGGIGLHVGVTPTTELWAEAGGVVAFDEGGGTRVFGAGAKQVLARGDNWQIAATGSLRHIELGADDDGQLATVGGVATICGDGCRVMGSFGMSLMFVEDEDAMPLWTIGLSVGNATRRLFGELVGAGNRDDRLNALMFGVRFGSKKVAFDAGLLRVLEEDSAILPLLSLVIRS